MATGKVSVSSGNSQVVQVNVSTLADGTAFEYNDVIYIKNSIFNDSGDVYYAFSICGYCVMTADETVTPVDLEIKVLR